MNLTRLFCFLRLHQCRSFRWDGYVVIRCRHCPYTAFLHTPEMTLVRWVRVRSVEDIRLVAERLRQEWRRRQCWESAEELLRDIQRAAGEEI